MGYPNHELVPAAILYMNPQGLTRAEFCRKLDAVRFLKTEWHSGLEGLAQVLQLKPRQDFKPNYSNRQSIWDGFTIEINKEFMYRSLETKKENVNFNWSNTLGENSPYWFSVVENKHILLEERSFIFSKHPPFKIGEISDLWDFKESSKELRVTDSESGKSLEDLLDNKIPYNGYFVKVLDVEKLRKVKNKHSDSELYKQIVHVQHYDFQVVRQTLFRTIGEFFSFYPELHPLKRFDFEQEEGKLGSDYEYIDTLCWSKKNGKYFLDQEYAREKLKYKYDPDCRQSPGETWGDFMMIVDAIRNKFWKVLGYCGLNHLHQFMIKYPEAILNHDRSVFDAYTSQYAQSKDMSITELLRMRQHMRTGLFNYNAEQIKASAKINIEMLQRYKDKFLTKIYLHESKEIKTDFSEEEIDNFANEVIRLSKK